MANVEDLKAVLKETLENRGVLSQVRARLRAEVFSALDEQSDLKPSLSNENLLINELIREYMDFNKYKYSCSVLTAEASQPKDRIDSKFLKQELNIEEDSASGSIPILYGIVSHFLQGKNVLHPRTNGQKNRAIHVPRNECSSQDETEQSESNGLIVYENP